MKVATGIGHGEMIESDLGFKFLRRIENGIEDKFNALAGSARNGVNEALKIRTKVAMKVMNSQGRSHGTSAEDNMDLIKSVAEGFILGTAAGAVIGGMLTGNVELTLMFAVGGAAVGMFAGLIKHGLSYDNAHLLVPEKERI
jgi:hypothetical protein